MGSTRKFKRKNRNQAKNQNADGKEQRDERRPYKEIIKDNEHFKTYYKAQKIVSEEEWDRFLEVMRTDLPTAFRIMGSSTAESERLLEIVRGQFFADLVNADGSREERRLPFPLPWYPRELGWQMELSRKDIRRSEAYFRLHNFLTSETACGAISRQEAVSMIPPLVLDVQPHHKVLDMCAAPGSKTAQIIELLHSGENAGIPEGFVIANDIDNPRCYMLVHQAKRLNSPCIAITNHDSGAMSNLTLPSGKVLKYDRILCDVPCCGDGTLRKNPDIWPKWNTANGNNLHGVQYRILRRGLELLEVGGKIVYSTCSMNPVQNEAVIHRILVETAGSVEVVDCKDQLPGLVTRPGMTSWLPASKDLKMYSSYDQVEEKWQTQVRPTMFPPSPEDAAQYHLEKCVRVMPHDQDTGCFFVTVLTKTKELPWTSGEGATVKETGETNPMVGREPQRKKRRIQGYKEDPYVFFEEDEPVWKSIREFYDIDGLDPRCLLTRCATGKKKNIYFVSSRLRDVVAQNQTRVKVINTGVKVFARCDNKASGCSFRLVQEGLESIKQFIGTKRRLAIKKEELVELLYRSESTDNPLPVENLSQETQERLQDISGGSCVLDYKGEVSTTLVGWKGTKTLRLYISKPESVHHLRLLGQDVSCFDVNKFKKESEETNEKGNGTEETTGEKPDQTELANGEGVDSGGDSKENPTE